MAQYVPRDLMRCAIFRRCVELMDADIKPLMGNHGAFCFLMTWGEL